MGIEVSINGRAVAVIKARNVSDLALVSDYDVEAFRKLEQGSVVDREGRTEGQLRVAEPLVHATLAICQILGDRLIEEVRNR